MKMRSLLAIGAISMLAWRPHAQAPQQPPDTSPRPTFKVEVNIIDVDATVTDEQGNHVAGLTVNDFELLDDGQPQKIETFSYVDIPLTAPVQFLGVDRPVSTDVRSNRGPISGRVYVIVLDDTNISPLRTTAVKQEARQFIESYVGVGDVAAVAYTSGRGDASQDFTGDPQLLLASVEKFIGRRGQSTALEAADKYYQELAMKTLQSPQSAGGNQSQDADQSQAANQAPVPDQGGDQTGGKRNQSLSATGPSVDITDFERSQRAIAVLDTLKTLAESLSGVRGRRKALVMFSEGIDYQMSDPFGMRSVTDVLSATRNAIDGAARSNVSFYTIDPRGLVGATSDFMQMKGSGLPEAGTQVAMMDDFRTSQDSLRTLAEETGGFASLDSNAFASAFERIVESNSQYYVLAYSPPRYPADGTFHKIDVRVKRPGLKVTARRGYSSARAQTLEERKREDAARRARDAKRPDGDTTSTELRNVLGAAIPQPGLGVSVHAAPFKNSERDASVALTIEIDGERLQFSRGKLELSFYSVNEQGKAGAGVRKELDLALKPDTIERVKTHGIRLNPRIALAPGRYQLRFGVRETAAGQSGSVFYDLIVPDFRQGTLAMSGLLLTSVAAQRTPTAEPDPVFSKLLPGAATSRREFPVGDTLAVYAEVYENRSSRQSEQIDVAVRLTSEAAIDVFTARDSIATGPSRPSNIFAQFALEDLEPGLYLLRVEAQRRGADAAAVARETLITVVR
jgi:VWFA-related protein